MRTIARTILGALMAVIGTATPRRQPSAPVLQIKSRKLEETAIGIMPLPPGVTHVTADNAAVRAKVMQDPIARGMVRVADQIIAAQEAHEQERQQKITRGRKQRARKRKQKRGY